MGFTTKEWLSDFRGHTIRVVNTWWSGAKLYIDGDCRDNNVDQITVSKDRPLLSASIDVDGERAVVEVFLVAWLTTKAKICVNGKQIGGDVF